MNRHATLLVIHMSMVMGVAIFASIVLLNLDWNELRFEMNPVDLAVGISLLMPAFIVPQLIASTMMRRIAETEDKGGGDEGDYRALMDAYQTKMIVRSALYEGLAFFSLVMLLSRDETQLLVMAGVAFLLLLAEVPLPMRVESWISSKLQYVRDERKFAGAKS